MNRNWIIKNEFICLYTEFLNSQSYIGSLVNNDSVILTHLSKCEWCDSTLK